MLLNNIFKPPDPYIQGVDFNFLPVENKDNLLITIGDSWSYGGSFQYLVDPVETNPPWSPALNKFRLHNVFGNCLRTWLDADWYNVSLPAVSNQWMVTQFEEFCRVQHQLGYQRIYVVITLTEVGREWNTDYESVLDSATSLDDAVFKSCAVLEDRILACAHNNINLLVGRNYIDDSYPRLSKFMLSRSWIEVLFDADGQPDVFADKCYMLGKIAFDNLQAIEPFLGLSRSDFLSMSMEYANRATKRLDLLSKSKYNIHKIGYQHPTPEGHKLWGQYVYNQFKERSVVNG